MSLQFAVTINLSTVKASRKFYLLTYRPEVISVKLEICCFKTSSLVDVFAIGVNDILHFIFDSLFHNAGPTVETSSVDFVSIPESVMPLVDDGHTAWIHFF